ncbi:hypothetical protein F5Y08DRAFT_300886 [Xylaria arbuscula]|nr:hypothetical protein F5Y08DRAFT_300886 [Xylaria arbuscula]
MQSEESNITPQDTGAERVDIPAKMETEEDPKQWFEEDEYEPPESFSEASPEADPMKVDKAEPKEEAIEPKLSKAKDVKETKSLPIDPAKLKAAMAAKPKAKLAAASKPTGVKKSTHVKPTISRPTPGKESTSREQAASKPAGVKTSTGTKPAVYKLASTKRTTDTRPTGSKPTGVKKSVKKPSIAKPLKLGKEVSVDDLLRKARVWVDRPKQWSIKDPETGCYGLSTQHAEGERREITIVHSINCDCLDVRLMHICKHVDALIRKRQLKRGSRDAFVIATKLDVELPQPIPKDIRFPHVKEQIIDSSVRKHLIKASRGQIPKRRGEEKRIAKPWREELEAEKKATIEGWKNDRQDYPETEARNVVDSYHQQPLIEKWKSLKGYKKRPIWRDW